MTVPLVRQAQLVVPVVCRWAPAQDVGELGDERVCESITGLVGIEAAVDEAVGP